MAQITVHRFRVLALKLLLVATVAATIPACTTAPPMALTADASLLQESDERREQRRELAAVPLEQRISMIEADMQRTLMPVGDGVLVPRNLSTSGSPGPLQIESNAAVLSALAMKYAATGDEQAKVLGEQIIRGILSLDGLSGELDGLVPFYVHPRTLEPTDHATHANVYTQLLFAYALADAYFGPNEDIRRHVSLMYQRWHQDGFRLRQRDGSFTPRADLRVSGPSLNARTALGRRLLDEAAYRLGDDETRRLVEQHRWRGPLLAPMHARLLGIELPTTSSSWLSLLGMTALATLNEPYERKIISLARRYERDDNPFFRLLAALHGADEDLADIRRRLDEFPYPTTTSGIINSHRDDLHIVRGRYIKFNAFPETREPLPLYEIGSSTYIWKGGLLQIDSKPIENPRVLLGHDLYQAYWLLRMLEERE